MKLVKYIFTFLLLLNFACSQSNGCIERITIPDNVIKKGTSYVFEPSSWIDLPCDYDVSNLLNVSEVLQNFSYEVINYDFTPDTGNNSSKLQFEVKLKNNNNFDVEGLPIFVMRVDGVESSVNYEGISGNCATISSNGFCTLKYTKETSFDTNITKSLELVSIKFLLAK